MHKIAQSSTTAFALKKPLCRSRLVAPSDVHKLHKRRESVYFLVDKKAHPLIVTFDCGSAQTSLDLPQPDQILAGAGGDIGSSHRDIGKSSKL